MAIQTSNILRSRGIESIEPFPGMHVAYGGRVLGNVDPRFGSQPFLDEWENRMLMRQGIPPTDRAMVITPKDAQGIAWVDTNDPRIKPSEFFEELDVGAEALVTNQKNVALMLNPADCIPLVYGSPARGVLSMIHVGRKHAMERFHEQVAQDIKEEFDVAPEDDTTFAYLGPSIHGKSYVMEELRGELKDDPDWTPFIEEKDYGFHIDVPSFVINSLTRLGMGADRIRASRVDTGNPKFNYFSYTLFKQNAEKFPNGRNGFVATLA